ncbi:cytosolic sulfotransferase 6 [Gossypium hirsutum]|uniref:Sulfotransferase n=1 Tax=Gossypium hirsutum TaxID=3635 RepID=A0A1U8J1N7_GOSHI|nr:cytosolic sulfotransferase 6-like [Gossypium hirsutum]
MHLTIVCPNLFWVPVMLKLFTFVETPKDAFVSMFHFAAKQRPKENEHISIEEAFELFCQGRSVFGPAWDHILVIGKLVKNDRKSFEEEQGGQVKKLIDLCSFENLSNLDVNKTGKRHEDDDEATNKTFFRKG